MKNASEIISYHPFLNGLQPYAEEIMVFCLGKEWSSHSVTSSRISIMESLDIIILPTDYISDVQVIVKHKYEWLFCYHRYRGVLTEKTHKLLI